MDLRADLIGAGRNHLPRAGRPGLHPGVTTNYELFSVAGPGPTAELFGVFAVSVVHNVIHLVLGVAGVTSGLVPAPSAAQSFLVVGGGLVLLLAAYGAAAVRVSP